MATLIIVSIRDRALDSYSRPYFVPTVGAAIRSFQDEVNRASQRDQANPLYDHPEDFDLFKLGTFDEDTGRFTNEDLPKQIAIGKEMRN